MSIDPNAPAPNDYVQLLDGDGNPCENFANVSQFIGSIDIYIHGSFQMTIYEIETPSGERYNVVRNDFHDTDLIRGWLEVDEDFYA